jgi:trimethylamine:corrinoid methyltransferase-like protein
MADMSGFLDEMESVMAGCDFLALPSTVEVMRAFYRPSAVFEHRKLRSWQGAGSRDLRRKARERIQDALARSDFELDRDRRRELDRIYAAAERELAS